MGNCASGKKKEKGDSEPDDKTVNDKPNEDVTYASINHENAKGARQGRPPTNQITDDDCDYATVNIPEALQPHSESECSSKDECADDYVLMG
ncbi:uncharacterized protein si:ch211-214p13.7 [Oreochromis aureus]|uniref:uncharacterized protein si:ch211-214p13.7 n=1 Tax=Oreochromis aureus TaxID=47969 RepID=UPI001952E147|nr:uncharacterized protein si:ch211-214p13.7 [Oreochromis aureus]CAI5655798.1 unnamed protein product [Mustela putorius furo]